MKNKFTLAGVTLALIGIAFFAFALTNPQLSFPWHNWVSFTLYGLYATYTVLVFCMKKMKNASLFGCVCLGVQFAALGFFVVFIGTKNTQYENTQLLNTGLFLTAFSQFANLYVTKKRKKDAARKHNITDNKED